MNDIDEKIRTALEQEDQKSLEGLGEQAGLFDLLEMTFSGRQAKFMYLVYAMGFASFFIGVYFAINFVNETDLKASLGWALAIIASLFALSLTKIAGWQQMHKMEMMREIKRLELRIMTCMDK